MNVGREIGTQNYMPPAVRRTIQKKPVERKLDLLEEVTILANSIKERLYKIDNIMK